MIISPQFVPKIDLARENKNFANYLKQCVRAFFHFRSNAILQRLDYSLQFSLHYASLSVVL